MTRTRPTGARRDRGHTVSHPHDPAERQADKAADVVARGGSVTGWSFATVTPTSVHREEKDKPKGASTEEKLKEGGKKVVEAALETETGKQIVKKVEASEPVKALKRAAESTPGKIVGGAAIAGALAGQVATGKNLPVSLPEIPLGKGWSVKPQIDTPITEERHPGITITFREQGGGKEKDSKAAIAAETAALRASLDMFKSQQAKRQEKADEQAAIAALLAAQARRFAVKPLIPLTPGGAPRAAETDEGDRAVEEKKAEDAEEPVQREPASASTAAPGHETAYDTSGVEASIRGGGRPIEPSVRRSMEARFGYDFGSVRIHDDAQANAAADRLQANAYTVGSHLVFGHGRYAPSTSQGRRLLAHELVHVVQQRGTGESAHVHRRSGWDTFLIWLGVEEGDWTDQELQAYLASVTRSGITKAYDADNKARAIVRKWKASSPGYDLLGGQKALLIHEMQHGPTLKEDEEAILDLLELSEAGDIREIFTTGGVTLAGLDSDIDGDRHKRLDAWVASRIKGGRPALEAGRVEVIGPTIPHGAPAYAFDPVSFDARMDSERSAEELVDLVGTFSTDDKRLVVDHLLRDVWRPAKDEIGKARLRLAEATTDAEKQAIADEVKPAYFRVKKSERLLQHLFLGEVPATAEALRKATEAVDPTLAEDLKEVLLPKQYTAEVEAEASPEAKSPEPPTFHEPAKYQAEIEKAYPTLIEENHDLVVKGKGPRATEKTIQPMAVAAKEETDAVYGQFYDASKHPELRFGTKGKPGNLAFWFEEAERERKAFGSSVIAKQWLLYYFQAEDVFRPINDKYAAVPDFDRLNNPRNAEAKILDRVATRAVKDPETRRKLLETRQHWGGMASEKKIYVDLFHSADADEDRRARWELFQTLIHEYLHTLRDDRYETYAASFGRTSPEWNTLIEGVDNVLGEVVWAHVRPRTSNPALRRIVEGETHAKLPAQDVPYPSRYPSYAEAMRLVSLVGIRNVYAAYFLGLVDRISVSSAAAAKAKAVKKP